MHTPLRIRVSLPVQQMPTMLMPEAPASRASPSIFLATSTTTSRQHGVVPMDGDVDRIGLEGAQVGLVRTRRGVPNSMSERSVESLHAVVVGDGAGNAPRTAGGWGRRRSRGRCGA